MRNFEDMHDQLRTLCRVLEKYTRVSRMPMDFGVDEPLFPSEVHMISAVHELGEASVSELGKQFGTTKGAASQMVDKLVAKGLLTKERDPEKRSRLIIRTTERGDTAHFNHTAHHNDNDREFFQFIEELPEDEYRTFDKLLTEMNRWMDSYLGNNDNE